MCLSLVRPPLTQASTLAPPLFGCAPHTQNSSSTKVSPHNLGAPSTSLSHTSNKCALLLECALALVSAPFLLECALAHVSAPNSMEAPSTLVCTLLAQEAKLKPLCALLSSRMRPSALQTLTLSFSSPHPTLSSDQVNNKPHPYPFPPLASLWPNLKDQWPRFNLAKSNQWVIFNLKNLT
jgi:hypothetical protein